MSQVVLTDELANLARHSSTHAAITHPRREVAIQVYLGQHVDKMHAWSLGSDVQGTAPASVGAASCERDYVFTRVSAQGQPATMGESSAPRATAAAQCSNHVLTPAALPSAYASSAPE